MFAHGERTSCSKQRESSPGDTCEILNKGGREGKSVKNYPELVGSGGSLKAERPCTLVYSSSRANYLKSAPRVWCPVRGPAAPPGYDWLGYL